ncbi:MAG: ABC transporter permease, partial [Gluconacetobacter diazotrophicus]|nr:ABC transporter permease [Gluconacetobacter diazotrophicus]
ARLQEKLRALPAAAEAAISATAPFSDQNWDGTFHLTGTPPAPPGQEPETTLNIVSPGYFQAMGIPLLRGRDFDARDVLGQPGAIVIDEEFAKRYFAGQDPVGRHLDDVFSEASENRPPLTIIGVVGHVRSDAPDEYSSQNMVQAYCSLQQANFPMATLLVRTTAADPLALAEPVRQAVQALDAELPVSAVSTMEADIGGSLASQRLTTTLLGSFAALALILAALGLYGVMALSVTQRTRELGIRLALGAQRSAVLALVLRQGATLVAVGLGIGVVAALALGRVLSHMLYGVRSGDLLDLGVVCVLLAVAALLACWLPARRATRLDPVAALRNE